MPPRRHVPIGLVAAVALLLIGLAAGAPTTAIAWAALGMMLGAGATAGATVGARAHPPGPGRDRGRHDQVNPAAPATPATPVTAVTPVTPAEAFPHQVMAAADLSEDVIRVLDSDGRIRWANRTACVRSARTLQDLLGRPAFGAECGYRIAPEVEARIARDIAAGTPFAETVWLESSSGRSRRLEVRGRPITGDPGDSSADGWITVEHDVTDLHDRTDLLDLVLDASRAGMWDWDVVTGATRTTPNMHLMIREPVPPGPVTIDWFTERVHPDDREGLDRKLQAALASDESIFEVTFRFGHPGDWVWIRTAGRVVARDAEGRPRRMIGLHVDLDEMHRSMIAAREATQLLHAIIDLVPTRICWKDRDGRHLGANRAYRADHGDVAVLGRTDAELGFASGDEDHGEPGRADVGDGSVDGAGRGGVDDEDTIERWTRADGSPGWRQVASHPLHDGEGAVIGTISSYQDITDLKAAAEALQRARDHAEAANLAKSEFLANMSHEIRTPMTAILGFADLLDEMGDDEEGRRRRHEAVETIRRNGSQLLAILNDILDLSKIEAGRMTTERIPVRPTELLGDIHRLLGPRADGKGIGLGVTWDTPVPAEVHTDPVRLRQILTNVVGNAIKFTETGEVQLHVGYDDPGSRGERLRIDVRDSGIGMDPDQVERVFDAFSQADSSTTRRFGGTGLGLRISRSLAEALGGSLTCRSAAGDGSVFTLHVHAPAALGTETLTPADAATQTAAFVSGTGESAAVATETTTSDRPPLTGLRVLLAEDGPDNQRLIGFHLRKAGADLLIADNGRLAVEAFAAADAAGEPFDIVLMDVQMPEMDGYAATAHLRAAGHRVPILALTAHAMAGDRARSLEVGCDEHLTKPLDARRLVASIRRWAGRTDMDRAAA